ncbi:MAG: hypothetical protein SGILL_000453 [Bacillariaceae sp.]
MLHPKKNKYYGRALDLLDTAKMLKKAQQAKRNLLEDLRKDYGAKYFDSIFKDENGHYRPFASAFGPEKQVSMDRFKRKLIIKFLSVKKKVKEHESNVNGMCDCWNGNNKAIPKKKGAPVINDGDMFEQYVWATGGHSSSAGHGNLYNESYTAFLEKDLVEVFGSVGIKFVGRNHAMGGTSSNGEIAMCWPQVFGNDVDTFSWDYGMTDGGMNAMRYLHYGYRGGLSQGRPMLFGLHVGGRGAVHRDNRLKELEEMGMAGFNWDDKLVQKMHAAVPDSGMMKEKELLALPDYVRNLKCNDQIEKGDPFCGAEKFNNHLCNNRGKQTGWHPGWKDHAMVGHGVSLFFTEVLIEALTSLMELQEEDDSKILTRLQEEDVALYLNFTKAPFPESEIKNLFKIEDDDKYKDFDVTQFLTGSNLCRTGRLPAQARYLGYMTEMGKTGGPAPTGQETYDIGLDENYAKTTAGNGTEMRLVRQGNDIVRDCPVTCHPDSKDVFFTNALDGWMKTTIPNEAEREVYQYNPSDVKGMLVIYLQGCDWGKCEKGFLKSADLEEKKWEMKVNGKQVESLTDVGFAAILAKFSDGLFVPPNERGTYDIEIKVKEKGSFVKISAFVIL